MPIASFLTRVGPEYLYSHGYDGPEELPDVPVPGRGGDGRVSQVAKDVVVLLAALLKTE